MTYPKHTPGWRRYLRFVRPSVQGDVDDELRFHFESRIEELVARGMSADTARAQAESEFGNVSQIREGLVSIDHRVAANRGRAEWVRDLAGDVTYAVRSLRRTPGVALAILATLSLGVGANAAMFTLLDAIFLRPPSGVVSPDGVRRLWAEWKFSDGRSFSNIVSYPQFAAATEAVGDRAATAIYRVPEKSKVGAGESATDLQMSYAATSYFSLLGARTAIGRFYSRDEDALDAPAPVAVISYAYWQRAFNGDASVLGKTIVIDGRRLAIVGVAARGFTGVELNATDAWLPIAFYAGGSPGWWKNTDAAGLFMLLRPRTGANERELEARIIAALRHTDDRKTRFDSASVVRFGGIVAANGPGQKSQEELIAARLAGVAIVVLLIACANVVNLLLARAVRRRREIAVRLALGISRARLIRLLLVESGVLALAAALVAIVVAYAGGTVLRRLLLPDIHWGSAPVDWRVVLFASSVAIVAGLVAGVIPAMQSASPELTSALKAGSGPGVFHRSRLRSALVIVQAALSVVLLVGAMLFVRSLSNVRNLDIGFDRHRLMTVRVGFDDRARLNDPTMPSRLAELAERITRVPGVERAALASIEPMAGFSSLKYFTESDSMGSRDRWFPTVTGVGPGYLATIGVRIVRGSDFPPPQGAATPRSVVVNEEMANGLWPRREAIGQCIRFTTRLAPCYTVVGVVENSRMGSVIEKPAPLYYLPLDQAPDGAKSIRARNIVVRAAPERIGSVATEIRELTRRQFPGGIPFLKTLDDRLDPQYRPWRLGATLFSAFGVLALIVAVVGIYSTVSYGVTHRIKEFGIRLALGAEIGDVLRLVIGEGLRTVAIGIALGVALALAGGRLIASLLYGVTPSDPVALTVVAAVLLIVGTAAALIPAWRAARVDPVSALRTE